MKSIKIMYVLHKNILVTMNTPARLCMLWLPNVLIKYPMTIFSGGSSDLTTYI